MNFVAFLWYHSHYILQSVLTELRLNIRARNLWHSLLCLCILHILSIQFLFKTLKFINNSNLNTPCLYRAI